VPADAISVPADSAAAVVKLTISIPREWCTNAKAKYSSSVVPPDSSVHFYHCTAVLAVVKANSQSDRKGQISTCCGSKTRKRISFKLRIYN